MGFAGRLARVLREPCHLWKILESGTGLPHLDRKVTDIHHVMTTLNVANTGLVPELVVFSEYDSKKKLPILRVNIQLCRKLFITSNHR